MLSGMYGPGSPLSPEGKSNRLSSELHHHHHLSFTCLVPPSDSTTIHLCTLTTDSSDGGYPPVRNFTWSREHGNR